MHCALVFAIAVLGASNRQVGVPIGNGSVTPRVTLTAPNGGWTVSRMLEIAGNVSDKTVDPVVVSINGDRYLMRTRGGTFSRKFPAASGKNVITVSATNRGGTGSAQVTMDAQVPIVPLKAVLTSDTDGVWTDLHIYEPKSKAVTNLDPSAMAHVYWADTESPSGGTFYLNEQGGDFDEAAYGPYLYVHRNPPTGLFMIATNYWPSGDRAQTLATLNLVLFEGTQNEVRRRIQIPLVTPGSTKVLALVNVLESGGALVYIPGQERLPTGKNWPGDMSAAISAYETSGANGGGAGEY
ncbi:MAG: DUF2135 domain-containing protein [Clostridia bacterium]|nr:DUF2135 domain-containing protein [Deltaproteobacteria bacterium]